MSEKLYIGWAERDITPDMEKYSIGLYGQYYARIAKGIHSRLKFSVCAMSSGSESFISGTVDVAGVPLAFTNLLKEEVAKRNAGIDVSRIFLNAIHTHSAPSLNVSMNYKRSVGGTMWQQGEFAKKWLEEAANGAPNLKAAREALAAHPAEIIGNHIRSMFEVTLNK